MATYRFGVVGAPGVGKSAWIKRQVLGEFDPNPSTIQLKENVQYQTKVGLFSYHLTELNLDHKIDFSIYDAYLLFYSSTNVASQEAAVDWLEQVPLHLRNKVFVCETKGDLAHQRDPDLESRLQTFGNSGCFSCMVNARTNYHGNTPFRILTQLLTQNSKLELEAANRIVLESITPVEM